MLHPRHVQPAPKQDMAFAAAEQKAREGELIVVVQELVQELHPGRAKSMDVNALSHLERDLVIDSLARTELIIRIERVFGVRLSAAAAGAVETVGDLLRALDEAHPEPSIKSAELGIVPLPLVLRMFMKVATVFMNAATAEQSCKALRLRLSGTPPRGAVYPTGV